MSRLPAGSLAYSMTLAARAVAAVGAGRSLADGLIGSGDAPALPAARDLVYGTLRGYGRGDFFLARLLARPLPAPEVRALLLVALSRLEKRPDSAHTVVDQAVAAAGELRGGRYRGLVNGVLRSFLRQQSGLTAAATADDVARCQHPRWWVERLRAAWPENWQDIVAAGNSPPPMAVRVNRRRIARDAYQSLLTAAGMAAEPVGEAGLALARPVAVEQLPGFADGLVSVQDPGAQRAAVLLDPQPGSRVLDACAAPGGKTAHLLERADLDLLALDRDGTRLQRVASNLDRLGLHAGVRVADCVALDSWWDGRPFDAVLADVPCSASGAVRRNPDAKWLRRDADIAGFAAAQARMLAALWRVVLPGGKLLYATCSVFPEENSGQIGAFLAACPDARCELEEPILPTAAHDGFYYCRLAKHA